MKFKTLLLACLSLFLTFSAHAEFYVSAGAAISKNTASATKNLYKADYDTSAVYSVAFGYDLPFIDIVRVEAEYLHNRAQIKKGLGYVNLDALMANAYVDIPFVLPLITPYAGAGIGYGRFETSNVLPMQLMLGFDAEIFVIPVIGSVEYRFMQTNRPAKDANSKEKYYSHMLMAKLRYEF
ncbi:MAG: hypothetical protein E7013_02345 [Alphaproteobacteria bacterium]|nr:hypothetical protein [Alphaproteobacteria bacterium]